MQAFNNTDARVAAVAADFYSFPPFIYLAKSTRSRPIYSLYSLVNSPLSANYT